MEEERVIQTVANFNQLNIGNCTRDTGSDIFHVQLPNQMHHTTGDWFSPVCRPTPVAPPVGTGHTTSRTGLNRSPPVT